MKKNTTISDISSIEKNRPTARYLAELTMIHTNKNGEMITRMVVFSLKSIPKVQEKAE